MTEPVDQHYQQEDGMMTTTKAKQQAVFCGYCGKDVPEDSPTREWATPFCSAACYEAWQEDSPHD